MHNVLMKKLRTFLAGASAARQPSRGPSGSRRHLLEVRHWEEQRPWELVIVDEKWDER